MPITNRTTVLSDGGGSSTKNTNTNANLQQASQRLSQQAVNNLTKGIVQQPANQYGKYGGNTAYTPRIVGSSSPQYLNNSTAKSRNATDNYNNTVNNSYGSGYGYGASDGGAGGVSTGASGMPASGVDDTLSKIKSLLEEQKKSADAYYKTLYEQQLASNKNAWENNRNQINLNYKKAERYLNNMYGDAISGTGLSNKTRNYSNWNNNLTENERNYANNDSTALTSYNKNLADSASTLAQGWYNYVMPIYTNRQTNIDDLNYRKYLAELGLLG